MSLSSSNQFDDINNCLTDASVKHNQNPVMPSKIHERLMFMVAVKLL